MCAPTFTVRFDTDLELSCACSMLGLLLDYQDTILTLFRTFAATANAMSASDFQRFAKRQRLCPRLLRPPEVQKVCRAVSGYGEDKSKVLL